MDRPRRLEATTLHPLCAAAGLTLALLGTGCGPSEPGLAPVTAEEIAAAGAKLICTAATEGEIECAVEEGTAVIAGHRLGVDAEVLQFLKVDPPVVGGKQFPGAVQVVARLTLTVDGQPLWQGESAGKSNGHHMPTLRDQAVENLLQRWGLAHLLPVVDAVGGKPDAPALSAVGMDAPAPTVEGSLVYAGYPILSGRGFDPRASTKMGPSLASLQKALGPFVSGLAPGLHTVEIHAVVGEGRNCGVLPPNVSMAPGTMVSMVPLSGTVEVDGAPKGDPCPLAEPVAWPMPPRGSVLEWDQKFVVVVPTTAPASATP
jgi:hypothetical protein